MRKSIGKSLETLKENFSKILVKLSLVQFHLEKKSLGNNLNLLWNSTSQISVVRDEFYLLSNPLQIDTFTKYSVQQIH